MQALTAPRGAQGHSRQDRLPPKQLRAGSACNFALGVLQEQMLSDESKGLLFGMRSDPSMLSTLGKVKDAAASIANQLSVHGSPAGKLPAVSSAVRVQEATSADEKPKTIMVAKAD